MNYIRHLNAVMERIAVDDRLNPGHVSLYLGLFQYWNLARFQNPISISRNEMMKISKIGSRNTYLKCLKELTAFGYIEYQPSHNPLKGSTVYMLKFDTSTEQVKVHNMLKSDTSSKQVMSPYKNNKKDLNQNEKSETNFHPPTLDTVLIFFKKITSNNQVVNPEIEGKKFLTYYTSKGWKVGNSQMKDWQAAAENWLLKSIHFNSQSSSSSDRLHTITEKNYAEPL